MVIAPERFRDEELAAPRAALEMKRGGAIIVEDPVVQDGTIVTAIGPEAAAAFGATLATLQGP